jgi:phenylalanyl-tRNA synthetase beta subunit
MDKNLTNEEVDVLQQRVRDLAVQSLGLELR